MNQMISFVEARHLKKDIAQFMVGDTVDVALKIVEEGKSRVQTFEGIVIARSGSGINETFVVRKISYGEGVEMVFPLHSPSIDKIKVMRKGDVRRAKLYYLKNKVGKATKVEEKITHAEALSSGIKAKEATPPREESK